MEEQINIGKLDVKKYNKYFEIVTDEIIITAERIGHILEEHQEDFEKYFNYIKIVIDKPDYILKDCKNKNTAMVIKHIEQTNINVIIRLAVGNDIKHTKNSIITLYRIRDKNLAKLLKKNKCIYKSE